MNTKPGKAIGVLLAALMLTGCASYADRAYKEALAEWEDCKWQESAGSPVYCGMKPEPPSRGIRDYW